MKHSDLTEQFHPYTRAFALTDHRAQVPEQTHDVTPLDVRRNGMRVQRRQGLDVSALHVSIVSSYDTICNTPKSGLDLALWSSVRQRRAKLFHAHRFNIVTVGIQQERRVVGRAVVLAQARRTVVAPAGLQPLAVKGIDGRTRAGRERPCTSEWASLASAYNHRPGAPLRPIPTTVSSLAPISWPSAPRAAV